MTQVDRRKDAWRERQVAAFGALVGRVVTGWDGIEMALRESSPTGIRFTNPQVPFLQLVWVHLDVGPEPATVSTYEDTYGSGLWLTGPSPFRPEACSGIYRWRTLDLPLGRIDAVRVEVEEDVLASVTLTVAGHDLLLVAGEVYETWTDRLDVHRFDESVLLFTDPADAQQVRWL